MESFAEDKFILNNMESWIHCLHMHTKKSTCEHLKFHHHEYIELLYSVKTDAHVFVNDKKYKFNDGDLVIINSNDPHTLYFNAESDYICVKFSPNILYADEQAYAEYKYAIPFLTGNMHQQHFSKEELDGSETKNLFFEIMDEWAFKGYAYELIIRANILKIFSWILRHWSEQGIFGFDKKLPDSIKTAIIYIKENYDTVTESEVAKKCGLSYNHFSSAFKNAVGLNFKDFLISVRIKKAENLLISTDMSITDISMECGFNTASHFIESFKKSKGITPNRFRRQLSIH